MYTYVVQCGIPTTQQIGRVVVIASHRLDPCRKKHQQQYTTIEDDGGDDWAPHWRYCDTVSSSKQWWRTNQQLRYYFYG